MLKLIKVYRVSIYRPGSIVFVSWFQINAEIAEKRRARLAKESEEEAVKIAEALRLADQKKREKIEASNRIIESETEAINNRYPWDRYM